MTVQDNYKLESYITNGSITSFDFSFKILEKEDIVVNVEDIQGNITQKQQQTDYDVILNSDFTGTVIFNTAPEKDCKIYIQRIVDLEQGSRYETSSGFQAEVVEKSFDKLTMISQQQQAEIDTCLKINQFEDVKISNYAETPIENKGIMWAKNEDGSFYLKNTQENPDDVYNEIVLNPDVMAIGSDLRTDNSIGICAENIEDINITAKNIEDINLCGGDIENIKNVGEYLKKHSYISSNILFDFDFKEHLIKDESWLLADTFSWQSGKKYKTAYNHLLNDIQGKTTQTETIGNTTISYYLAEDGHKIVDVANISQVESVYSETGIAWYYVIDTVNTQFKLPRTKYGFVGLRNSVGNFVNETLPNITGSAVIAGGNNQMQVYNTTGALTYTESGTAVSSILGDSGQANKGLTLNANLSNPVYQDNAPVQQKATEMYLYFYVGNFTREAVEETAGLNSELFNGKVDLDGSNATFTNLPDTTKQNIFNNLSETSKETLYKNIFSLIQTTDSTKIGYYCYWWNGNNYKLPAGGTWLVWSIHQQAYNNFTGVGSVNSAGCGLFAGGSTITYGNAYTIGWAIRIQ